MILKNCKIITQNSKRDIIPCGFIKIKKDKIVKIGRGFPKKIDPGENVINFKNKTVLPGFINAHCHLGDLIYKKNINKIKSPENILEITNKIDSKINKKDLEKRKQKSCFKSFSIFSKDGITTLAGGRGLKEASCYNIRFFFSNEIRALTAFLELFLVIFLIITNFLKNKTHNFYLLCVFTNKD